MGKQRTIIFQLSFPENCFKMKIKQNFDMFLSFMNALTFKQNKIAKNEWVTIAILLKANFISSLLSFMNMSNFVLYKKTRIKIFTLQLIFLRKGRNQMVYQGNIESYFHFFLTLIKQAPIKFWMYAFCFEFYTRLIFIIWTYICKKN